MALDVTLINALSSPLLTANNLDKTDLIQAPNDELRGFQKVLAMTQSASAIPPPPIPAATAPAKPPATSGANVAEQSGNPPPASASPATQNNSAQAKADKTSAPKSDASNAPPKEAVKKEPQTKTETEESVKSTTAKADASQSSATEVSDAAHAEKSPDTKDISNKTAVKNEDEKLTATDSKELDDFQTWFNKSLGLDQTVTEKKGNDDEKGKQKSDKEKDADSDKTKIKGVAGGEAVIAGEIKIEASNNDISIKNSLKNDSEIKTNGDKSASNNGESVKPEAIKTDVNAIKPDAVTFVAPQVGLTASAMAKPEADVSKSATDDHSSPKDKRSLKNMTFNLNTVSSNQPEAVQADATASATVAVKTNVAPELAFQNQFQLAQKLVDGAVVAFKPTDNSDTKAAASANSSTNSALLNNLNASLGQSRTASAPLLSTAIRTPLTHPGWGAEVADKVLWMASQKVHAADISINPPDLGPVEAKIKMEKDQINVIFSSQHLPVKEALEQSLPKLREMMAQNGVNLGSVDVRDHSQSQQQQWRQADTLAPMEINNENEAETTAIKSVISAKGMVDFYA